jgi:hypothetical protein
MKMKKTQKFMNFKTNSNLLYRKQRNRLTSLHKELRYLDSEKTGNTNASNRITNMKNFNCVINENNKANKENMKDKKNNDKTNINDGNHKIKNNKEINIKISMNSENDNKKENTDTNKTYSESDLGEVGGEIIDDESENEKDLDEIDELNEKDNIYYYEPKSIVNYSSVNFTNKKYNRKYQSLSVSKENKLSNNIFSKTINNSINKKNLFNINDLNRTQNINLTSQIFKNNKINEIKNLNDKINMKNKEIEKINRLIENIKKQIKKYDNEIRVIDTWIEHEEKEGHKLRHMINFVNTK